MILLYGWKKKKKSGKQLIKRERERKFIVLIR